MPSSAQHDTLEHLALMEACLGPFPLSMTKSKEASKYFDRSGRLQHSRTASSESLRHVKKMKTLAVGVGLPLVVFFGPLKPLGSFHKPQGEQCVSQ